MVVTWRLPISPTGGELRVASIHGSNKAPQSCDGEVPGGRRVIRLTYGRLTREDWLSGRKVERLLGVVRRIASGRWQACRPNRSSTSPITSVPSSATEESRPLSLDVLHLAQGRVGDPLRRQAAAVEQACGALAREVGALVNIATEVVERPAPPDLPSRWRRRPVSSGLGAPRCSCWSRRVMSGRSGSEGEASPDPCSRRVPGEV